MKVKLSNLFTVFIGRTESVNIEKSQHKLEIFTIGQESPILKVLGIRNILSLRDLLNDAYPVAEYQKGLKSKKELGKL